VARQKAWHQRSWCCCIIAWRHDLWRSAVKWTAAITPPENTHPALSFQAFA
jgi:hypothetical protein